MSRAAHGKMVTSTASMCDELPNGEESFYARPRFSSRAASAELRNSHGSGAHYSHWPDNGIRCVSARLPRWGLYLFVVQSGHQEFRDAMPIYISRGRFRRPVHAQPHLRSPLIAEGSPVLGVVY